MTDHIPQPRRIPVAITPDDVGIASDLFMTIVNTGWSPVFINLEGADAVVDRGPGDNIMIPAKGYLPNIPPTGRTKISAIAEHITSFLLLTFTRGQGPPPAVAPDGMRLDRDFHATMINDNVAVLLTQVAWVTAGGHRKRATVIRAVTHAALVSVNGTAPNRATPIGIPIQAGDSVTVPVDSYSDIQVQNLVAGNNTEVHGFCIGD